MATRTWAVRLDQIAPHAWEQVLEDAFEICRFNDYGRESRDISMGDALSIARIDPGSVFLYVETILASKLARILDATHADLLHVLDESGQVIVGEDLLVLPYRWDMATCARIMATSRRPWAKDAIEDYLTGGASCVDPEDAIGDWVRAAAGARPWFVGA